MARCWPELFWGSAALVFRGLGFIVFLGVYYIRLVYLSPYTQAQGGLVQRRSMIWNDRKTRHKHSVTRVYGLHFTLHCSLETRRFRVRVRV